MTGCGRGPRRILNGLTVTGGGITCAGVVLAAIFCVLAAIPTVVSLQQGLLIAIGILLDAFLVHSLLIPALSLGIGARIRRPGHPEDEAPPRSERPSPTARVDVGVRPTRRTEKNRTEKRGAAPNPPWRGPPPRGTAGTPRRPAPVTLTRPRSSWK